MCSGGDGVALEVAFKRSIGIAEVLGGKFEFSLFREVPSGPQALVYCQFLGLDHSWGAMTSLATDRLDVES